MDLYDMLKTEFTGEDEGIFMTNFKYCLEHDPYNDFIINLDDILHYLGYTRKETAKKLIVKYFEENTSYRLLRFGPQQDHNLVNDGAHNKERILLSPNTFKELCLLANTDKAKRIRMYYIRMEMVLSKYISKQNEKLLEVSTNKIKTLENELKIFRGRKKNKYEFGDTVYLVKEGNIWKAGSALNMNYREDSYYCHSNLAKVVYAKRCNNRKILEDVMHHKFREFTYNNRKDWFIGVDFETLRNALDEAQLLLDNKVSPFTIDIEALNDKRNNEVFYQAPAYQFSEEAEDNKKAPSIVISIAQPFIITKSKGQPQIQQYDNSLLQLNTTVSVDPSHTDQSSSTFQSVTISETPHTIESSTINESSSTSEPSSTNEPSSTSESSTINEPSSTSEKISTTITSISNPEINISDLPDIPPDFDGFIRECFVLKKDVKTSWVEIGAKYRIWSRSLGQVKDALYEYLKQHTFKESFIYNEHTKTNSIAFEGLEMIPLKPFEISENSTEIERFVYDTCVNNVTGRVAAKDIYEKFVEWKHESDKKYTKLHKNDKLKLSGFFNNRYLAATVHNGERIRFGYYGISLKGKEDVGTKPKRRNRKIINMIHPHTKELMRTFESVTHASKELGVTISAVSIAISNKKICKGYFFEVAA